MSVKPRIWWLKHYRRYPEAGKPLCRRNEFSLQDGRDEEVPEEIPNIVNSKRSYWLPRQPMVMKAYRWILESARLGALSGSSVITVHQSAEAGSTCAQCGESGHRFSFLRKCYLGAPFYVSNAVPTVLEFCPDPEGVAPESLPGRGRKLITFTDSRQGTARMAVRMQQEAERSRLRGLVFEVLRNRQALTNMKAPALPDQSVEELLQQAEQLESMRMWDLARRGATRPK